jgi:hypothetical protein
MTTETQTQRGSAGLRAEAEAEYELGPNGPAMAAILGAALGVFSLGLATFISAAAIGAHDWFEFQRRVGPLSGKTTMAGVAWLVSWAVLHAIWWKREVPFVPVAVLAGILIVAGNLLMFPPIFERFEPE